MSSETKKRMKRAKPQPALPEADEEPPPPKKVRKVKAAVAVVARKEPAVLGSLPLYGEELPDGGFDNIPLAAKEACKGLKEVLSKIRAMEGDLSPGAKPEVNAENQKQKQKALILFASLRRMNRLSHLYCKDTREQTHEQKLEVDDLHLQLQNLKYEAMHLRREINSCLEFQSRHEDIDLVTEEEFYKQAPETISKPEITTSDEHQRMLCRLAWELEQRKQLYQQQEELEKELASQEAVIKEEEEKLEGLHPALDALQRATLPLQGMLGLPLDQMREEESTALLLPEPLYILYVQSRGYAQVEDPTLSVSLLGDADEAKDFCRDSPQHEMTDEESGESDNEGGKEASQGRKKHKKSKSSDPVDVSKPHPLSVHLTFTLKNCGTFKLVLTYLPHFSVVCVNVTTATIATATPPLPNPAQLDKSMLLPCLFEGDTGRVSPNTVVSYNIRKHGGDIFSAAVRACGFPYKWVQSLCGISVMGDSGDGGSVRVVSEVSVESMERVVSALKRRFRAQVNLSQQITRLEECKTWLKEEPPSSPLSTLIRWKSITIPEAQSLQFGSESIFNFQDRTNRFYLATLQNGQDPGCVKMHSLVCLSTDYPAMPPSFAVRIHTASGKKEPHDIHIKNIETQVNIHFPRSLSSESSGRSPDASGRSLMLDQVHLLRECLDLYVGSKVTHFRGSQPLLGARGKGRLLFYA